MNMDDANQCTIGKTIVRRRRFPLCLPFAKQLFLSFHLCRLALLFCSIGLDASTGVTPEPLPRWDTLNRATLSDSDFVGQSVRFTNELSLAPSLVATAKRRSKTTHGRAHECAGPHTHTRTHRRHTKSSIETHYEAAIGQHGALAVATAIMPAVAQQSSRPSAEHGHSFRAWAERMWSRFVNEGQRTDAWKTGNSK